MNTLGAAVWTALFGYFYFSNMMKQIKEKHTNKANEESLFYYTLAVKGVWQQFVSSARDRS